MACCIFAAFLVAQAVAMLRRWGMFWGVVRPRAGEESVDTIYSRIAAWLARPGVRRVAVALLTLELAGFGTWVYAEHGEHLAGLAAGVFREAPPAVDPSMCAGGADLAADRR